MNEFKSEVISLLKYILFALFVICILLGAGLDKQSAFEKKIDKLIEKIENE